MSQSDDKFPHFKVGLWTPGKISILAKQIKGDRFSNFYQVAPVAACSNCMVTLC